MNTRNNTIVQSSEAPPKGTIYESIKWFWPKIWMILGLSTALHTPAQSETINLVYKNATPEETAQPQYQPTIEWYTPRKGESVGHFIERVFGKNTDWRLLKNVKTGEFIKNPRRDLVIGEYYTIENISEHKAVPVQEQQNAASKKSQPKESYENLERRENALMSFKDMDFNTYLGAISLKESEGNYGANNSKIWKMLKVHSSKFALGKYQFIHETLRQFGINTARERKAFLNSRRLQEDIMRQYTYSNMNNLANSKAIQALLTYGVRPYQLLAASHHAGRPTVIRLAKYAVEQVNPKQVFFNQLKYSKDWMKTKTYDYVAKVSLNYYQISKWVIPRPANDEYYDQDTVQVAQNDEENINNPTPTTMTKLTQAQIIQLDKKVIQLSSYFKHEDTKEYIMQTTQNIQNNQNTPSHVKNKLLATLSKVTDVEAFFYNQMKNYELNAASALDGKSQSEFNQAKNSFEKMLAHARKYFDSKNSIDARFDEYISEQINKTWDVKAFFFTNIDKYQKAIIQETDLSKKRSYVQMLRALLIRYNSYNNSIQAESIIQQKAA